MSENERAAWRLFVSMSMAVLASGSIISCRSNNTEQANSSGAVAISSVDTLIDAIVERAVATSSKDSVSAVVLIGTRECSSCRGVGLALRTLSNLYRVILVFDERTRKEVEDLVRQERLAVSMHPIASDRLRRALRGEVGGSITVVTPQRRNTVPIGPRDDWPTVLAHIAIPDEE